MSSGRKRPDTAKRKKERSKQDEYVIKTGLFNHLKKKELLESIDSRVINISKISNRGSLIFNRLLLYCIENNIKLPNLNDRTFFNHCFGVGFKRFNKEDELVKKVFNQYFSDFPVPEMNMGDTQTLGYAASAYMTNFHTYLVETFYQKQKKWIKEFCKRNNLDKEQTHIITYKINNWKTIKTTEISPISMCFIEQQKKIMKINDEEINKMWLKQNIAILVYFNYEALKQFEEWNLKLFTLAPVTSIRKHFMVIDNTILYSLMKDNGIIENITIETFMKSKEIHWNNIFQINKSKGQFSYFIETDGISICFHYLKDKKESNEISSKEYRKAKKIIAIDPGRTNLMYGVEKDNNKTYKLTRKQYYHEAGITKANKKSQKWNKQLEKELTILSTVSIKTTKSENWVKFLKKYKKYYNLLWDQYTQNKWGRQRFNGYITKNKCLDKFFASMKKDGETPVIAYGAAKFNPTNKNELSAPTTSLSRKCSKHYITKMEDEFRTSKMCSSCGEELKVIKREVEGKVREVRGLRWCGSTKCRKFVNRDLNAAVNILKCFLAGNNRPNYLARNPRNTKGSASQSQAQSVQD